MNERPMRLLVGTKIRHKNGKDYIIEGIPWRDTFYCRTADSKKEFKCINIDAIEFIHSVQIRLDFPL